MGATIEIKQGYKKTKLGLIPEEWEIVKGKEITSIITKGSSPKWQGFEYKDSGVLFVTSENVRSSYLDISKPKYLPLEFNIKEKKSILKKGDILINIVGASIGRAALFNIDEIANINQAVSLFRTNHKVIDTFIVQFLNNDLTINRLLGIQSDGARPNLSLTDLRDFKIPLPPIPEQKKIADILSTWDKAIETTQALIKKLQLRKKGLMQQLLTGKKRLPGFSGEWEEVQLGEVFSEIKSKNDGNGHEPLTISSKSGFISQRKKFDKVIAGSSLSKYIQLKKFDFSYNKGNSKTYPMGCIFLLEKFETAVVPFVYINFTATKKIDKYFYKYWFENYGLDRQLKAIITSGARGDGLLNVSKSDFFKLFIPYPKSEEQTAIAQVLTKADEEIHQTQHYLEQLQEQKKGLMQQLLTGQKRVVV